MRFSLWLGPEQTWDELVGSAVFAERAGWDGLWVEDHFMPDSEPLTAPRLEGWTSITAVAARTQRVRVGVLVTGNTYRHPAVLANMAATVDHISEGRLVFGIGAGWQMSEHRAYGIELPAVGERLARLDEACQVIRLLHGRERSDFEGRFYRLVDAPCEPKPVQRPLPLLIGGSGEKTLMRIAARYADEWNCWGLPEVMAHKVQVFDRHCLEIERDPRTIKRSTQALVFMSDDATRLKSWRSEVSEMPRIIGTPAEVLDVIGRYVEIGLDEFILSDETLGPDVGERRDNMDRFWNEVAVNLRDTSSY